MLCYFMLFLLWLYIEGRQERFWKRMVHFILLYIPENIKKNKKKGNRERG